MTTEDKIGNIVETKIIDLAYNGQSVGEMGGKIIFLNGGLPGETVRARIVKRKARYNLGRVENIIEKCTDRVKAPCIHFDICGGCTWQDLNYEKQLYYKRKQVVDSLSHIGKIDNAEVAETIGCQEQFYYRNKMEFSFNTSDDEKFTLGLHRRGRFDEIFNLRECLLESPVSNEIVIWFQQFVRGNNIPAYDVTSHEGFLRFLVIRQSKNKDQIMLNIVTAEGTIPNFDELSKITDNFPQIKTIVQNINTAKSNIARGEEEKILFGNGYIEEELLGYSFKIYANSFFQTNSKQAEILYKQAFKLLKPEKDDQLLDLYCGTGTIGICASRHVDNVVGIDLEPSAIKAAEDNALVNDVGNINFYTGSVREILTTSSEIFKAKALKKLRDLSYKKIIYISGNPTTFSRDAASLIKAGYEMSRVTPVDMFPHTMHIEVVAGFYKSD
jgi:23S rRNA (uracil1939-C5)-methyltransferase